jgi:hypothetical protein
MNTTKLARLDALMNQLIFYLHATGMTYQQAEEEAFRMLKRKRLSKETHSVPQPTHHHNCYDSVR